MQNASTAFRGHFYVVVPTNPLQIARNPQEKILRQRLFLNRPLLTTLYSESIPDTSGPTMVSRRLSISCLERLDSFGGNFERVAQNQWARAL